MNKNIITFNAGSSSLKFAIFEFNNLSLNFSGQIVNILEEPKLFIKDKNNQEVFIKENFDTGYLSAIKILFNWIKANTNNIEIISIGHRVVHGGSEFKKATKITPSILQKLKKLIPLAPLHQPYNIELIEIFKTLYPDILQIACFDTSYHHTISNEAKSFALPRKLSKEGIVRYGFHGLSYQYICSVLPQYINITKNSKIIIAHLGNGASMCAIKNYKSLATTMGFTALDGLVMGTRSGNLDPGVILYLLKEKKMTPVEITKLLYEESGLKGVSGISHDMNVLLKSNKPEAQEAINLFCYQAARQLAGLVSDLDGLDMIVFTAGIGENSYTIRKNICDRLKWLGVILDKEKNLNNDICISRDNSKIKLYVIPTNEELMIATLVKASIQI